MAVSKASSIHYWAFFTRVWQVLFVCCYTFVNDPFPSFLPTIKSSNRNEWGWRVHLIITSCMLIIWHADEKVRLRNVPSRSFGGGEVDDKLPSSCIAELKEQQIETWHIPEENTRCCDAKCSGRIWHISLPRSRGRTQTPCPLSLPRPTESHALHLFL